MESPYYEMTHDIEEEHRIATDLFNKGYLQGLAAGTPIRDAMVDLKGCRKEESMNYNQQTLERWTETTSPEEPSRSLAENLRKTSVALEETKCALRDILLNLKGKTPTEADAPPRTNPENMIQHSEWLLETAYANSDMARVIRVTLLGE